VGLRCVLVGETSLDTICLVQQLYWDVEWDEAEEKLNEIMADAQEQPDGLFKYQGRLLEMRLEGGGWFDCRRPPYYGTNSKTSTLIHPHQPLVQDPEVDYSYESDADWCTPSHTLCMMYVQVGCLHVL
jgi:hypothetical protein